MTDREAAQIRQLVRETCERMTPEAVEADLHEGKIFRSDQQRVYARQWLLERAKTLRNGR